MSRFDLNEVQDFTRLTGGSIAAIAQTLQLAGQNPSDWDIQEGSYRGVLFHVITSKSRYQGALAQVTDTGGRRKVKYQFPYTDGQTTDDLGRKAESYDFDVLIHGPRYIEGFTALVKALQDPTPGILIHPVLGDRQVVVEDYSIVHANDKRKAAQFRLVFIEHTFTIGTIRQQKDTSVKGALSSALDAFKKIDAAVTNVLGAVIFAASLRRQVAASLQEYRDRFQSTLTSINKTFNTAGSSDIPGLLPVNDGGTVSGGNFPVATSPNDPFSAVPDGVNSTTAVALAAEEVTKQVNETRAFLGTTISSMEDMGDGVGALEFHDEILDLKNSGISLQQALETGIASSNAKIIDYTIPSNRVMSLREVAFANGLNVNRVTELDQLNPELLSVNFLEAGTKVRVPTS